MPKPRSWDRTSVTYVALKRMNVNGTVRNIGDAVPEAAHWRNLHNYLSAGYLKIVGERSNNPAVKQGKWAYTQQTKPAGNKPYTNYHPVSDDLSSPSLPVDKA